jgi:3'-phosphoadenosine 5'-phosphosulfate sulfotransferase (PAPS reductase)/FAD synthetase
VSARDTGEYLLPVQRDWLDRLSMTDDEVAALPLHDRMGRVHELMDEAHDLVVSAAHTHVYEPGKRLAASVVLFSGGNDSTVLAHLMWSKKLATHFAHANTTVGIEQTRQFVRDVSKEWGVPLIERKPPRIQDQYRALVLDQGFPGPGHHYKMFQRLKERALHQIRNELVNEPYRERVLFLAGRRRQESHRRANVPELERTGSIVWVSPLVNWTKPDLNTYREMFDVPRNEVADLCHMSGECLCGAFAHEGERAEIMAWYPEAFYEIAELEYLLKDRTDLPEHRKTWGWGGDPATLRASREKPSKLGRLCSSCDSQMELLFDADEAVA